MRISDWSSDVCSSDLGAVQAGREQAIGQKAQPAGRLHADDAAVLHVRFQQWRQRRRQRAVEDALHPVDAQRIAGEAQTLRCLHMIARVAGRSEEHTSELQSLMRISYAVFCLKKKKTTIEEEH